MKNPSLWSRPAKAASLAVLLVLWVACGTFVPQAGWDPQHGPVIPHDTFPADCALCHTGGDWHTLRSGFVFDHGKETGVVLNGAHKETLCLYCHNDRGPVARYAAQGCVGCHVDIHGGNLGAQCSTCHDERTWRPNEQIEQHDRTRFPLLGAHAAVACVRCHEGAQGGNFVGASPQCETCHQNDLTRSVEFDHLAQGFTADCQRCHRPVGWLPAQFAHPQSFPLIAGHSNRTCNSCHAAGSYAGLSTQCSSCHQDDANRTTDPNHVQAGFNDCEQCHTIQRWRPSSFAHTPSFPLTHGHSGRRCAECHTGGAFSAQSSACSACHLDDYQQTTNPNHSLAGYSTSCETCHSTSGWGGANFSHTPAFPLTNGHAGRRCAECHTGGVFAGQSSECRSCHLDDYQATTNPNHTAANYSTSCEQCHNTSGWGGANFNHRFPRTGNHNVTCTECHTTPNNYQAFSCIHCHAHRQSAMDSRHGNRNGYVWESSACLRCHPNGRG